WLGLVGMADPVREGVNDIIEVFHSAGIDTVMITGDQSPTAYAVARQLNLSGKGHLRILDSAELAGLDHEKLAALSKKASVYSRVSPAHKLQIVHALQSDGTVVAMTGDGINDGPALKAADIGIAMGRSGTDVAREVADVVLEDDNLETLILAVKGGRTIYNNIRKSVHFFLSTNLSEIMLLSSGVALGLGTLLNPMQLLWINLISDIFPGLALSMEAAEPDVLDRPPRKPNSPLFDGADFKRMGRESLVLTAGALAAYGYGAARYGAGPAAGGLAFQTLTVSQLLHAVSCRSENRLLFEKVRPPKNRYVTWAVAGSLALQGLTMVAPGPRKFFSVAAPRLADLAVVGATVVGTFVANQLLKPGSAHGDGKQTSTQGKEAPAAALPTH
ncbi:MAG: HAD-IC family P-type ATPase, partial [Desulfatibacillaceae bacterium]